MAAQNAIALRVKTISLLMQTAPCQFARSRFALQFRAASMSINTKSGILCIRDGNGPGRPRAGPENPGPRALRAETGLMIFYLRAFCSMGSATYKNWGGAQVTTRPVASMGQGVNCLPKYFLCPPPQRWSIL